MLKFSRLARLSKAFACAILASSFLASCSNFLNEPSALELAVLDQIPNGWKADTTSYLTELEEQTLSTEGIAAHFSHADMCELFVLNDKQTYFDSREDFGFLSSGWLGVMGDKTVLVTFYSDSELPDCVAELASSVQFDVDNEYGYSDLPIWRASKENISRCLVEKSACLDGYKLSPPEEYQDTYWVGGDPIIKCRAEGLCCMDAACEPNAMAGTLSGLGSSSLDAGTLTDNPNQGVNLKTGEWNILFEIVKTKPDIGDTVVFGNGWIMYWDGVSEKPSRSWFLRVAKLLGGTVQDVS